MIPRPVFFVYHHVLNTCPTLDSLQIERDESQRTFSTTSHNILLSGNGGYAESIVAGQHSLLLPFSSPAVSSLIFPLEHQSLLSTPLFSTKQQWRACCSPLRGDISGMLDFSSVKRESIFLMCLCWKLHSVEVISCIIWRKYMQAWQLLFTYSSL